jgi:hypothetical protein
MTFLHLRFRFQMNVKIILYRLSPKKRRVHSSLIYRRILIIYTPNQMVVSRLQNGLINLRIATRASRLNCQNIFFQMGLHTFF